MCQLKVGWSLDLIFSCWQENTCWGANFWSLKLQIPHTWSILCFRKYLWKAFEGKTLYRQISRKNSTQRSSVLHFISSLTCISLLKDTNHLIKQNIIIKNFRSVIIYFIYCFCVKLKTLCNCLCSSSSRFSASRVRDYWIVNRYSWFWKFVNMADLGGELSFVHGKNWYKKWCLHFHKTYDYQISQAGTSRGFDSNETKATISPLPQCLWPPNLAGWWLTLSDFYP